MSTCLRHKSFIIILKIKSQKKNPKRWLYRKSFMFPVHYPVKSFLNLNNRRNTHQKLFTAWFSSQHGGKSRYFNNLETLYIVFQFFMPSMLLVLLVVKTVNSVSVEEIYFHALTKIYRGTRPRKTTWSASRSREPQFHKVPVSDHFNLSVASVSTIILSQVHLNVSSTLVHHPTLLVRLHKFHYG